MRSDKDVQNDVVEELAWEPSVTSQAIGVTVCDGVVTLAGHVPTYSEKANAERVAKRVLGVKAVTNGIEVRLAHEQTDSEVARAALNALKWIAAIPAERIKVTVLNGLVNLTGEVDWYYEKATAEETVRNLLGVRGVVNKILIKTKASAPEVKSRIEDAFRRHAELDAQKIRVEAHDGTVTLRGELHSWAECEEAEKTAWSAPGVTRVENLIAITPRLI